MSQASNLLQTIDIEVGANPASAIIWLHGLGADGHDFVPMASQLDLMVPVRFVFPHAPMIPVTLNGNYPMRAWFDVCERTLVGSENTDSIQQSKLLLEKLIEKQIKLGIPPERIILAGFSQGCAMVLHTGLRYPKQLAGLLCLSGYLPLKENLAKERNAVNQQIPIFMAHGEHDNIVPFEHGVESRDFLNALGYKVEWNSYLMQHTVCNNEIQDINRWLNQVLQPPRTATNNKQQTQHFQPSF